MELLLSPPASALRRYLAAIRQSLHQRGWRQLRTSLQSPFAQAIARTRICVPPALLLAKFLCASSQFWDHLLLKILKTSRDPSIHSSIAATLGGLARAALSARVSWIRIWSPIKMRPRCECTLPSVV